jgi:hypothetical protein
MWTPQILDETSSYDDLITGKIPALIIPKVLSKSDCISMSSKILDMSKTNNSSTKFGTSLSSHIYEKQRYFSKSKKSNEILKNLFSENTSPLTFMQQKISKLFGKKIYTATENGNVYSDAVIRIHDSGDSVHLHRDNSNFEMSEFNVSRLKNQLSAILYLQCPDAGGELTIFHKMWSKKDEMMREPEFGYSSDLIRGVYQTKIRPIAGNMVILNPKFYHQIESISGLKSRIALTFFFGESSKDSFNSWT